ncbi:Fe(3+)-hydroxamate ABC transporter permease FhuB [Aureimonas frigidaquae]|uniref:Fe(3+)-hydroxamate ABC transporter permease FhuB n=1 Tax=Aureimonas frigidaquae TaxID=424757 RepID=UPI0007808740|nr:Fe(3+)-hydroxamate ABC transporter permease FhuB [Aureimonas frigidaquae]
MTLRPAVSPPQLVLGLLAASALCALLQFWHPMRDLLQPASDAYDVERLVFLHATLPRLVLALLVGAGLGASGAVMQMALRNPLASPTTLGTDGGARLAIAAALVFTPGLLGWGRDVAALCGSAMAMLAVLGLTRRQGFSPVPLVLAGLMLSLLCAALAGILQLTHQRYLEGLFIWGSGSLSVQGWAPVAALSGRLLICAAILAPLMRPLRLIELGDASAKGLGLKVARWRLAAIFAGLLPAAFVTSAVGVFGFIGLVAPLLARAAGATTPLQRLVWSALTGAGLLVLTDLGVQWAAGGMAAFVPTGAVTAVLGSPLLLWLLPRLNLHRRVPPAGHVALRAVRRLPGGVPALLALAVALMALTLVVGRLPGGAFSLAAPSQWAELAPWRVPRMLAAFAAGGLLGAAGAILQRVSGNDMASPEILGVGAGALIAMAAGLLVAGLAGGVGMAGLGILGGVVTVALVLGLARRSGFSPERVLLSGIAINALADAMIGVLTASGDPRGFQLLRLIGGTASAASYDTVLNLFLALAAICAAGLAMRRWLMLLPLGGAAAQALGVPLQGARAALLCVAALAAALAVPVAGTVSFVGLMAPHLVTRLAGPAGQGTMLLRAALAGGIIMVVADWVARIVAFPFQLPTGLVACLVGGPFLLILLQRAGTHAER